MKQAQTVRIVLLLAVIFAAGVVTGRLGAPRPPALVRTIDGRLTTSDTAFERLRARVNLTPEQERSLRQLFEEIAPEMAKLPPASQERMDVFLRNVPRMRALLRPDQHPSFENHVRDIETRWEKMLKRKKKSADGATRSTSK